MTDLASDYAGRILAVQALVERLNPDRRDPHRFLEDKDTAVKTLGELANEVQLDQVFAKLPAHPASPRVPASTRPRTITDRRGRSVPVEVRPQRKISR